jgi:hypothetical protein
MRTLRLTKRNRRKKMSLTLRSPPG